MAQLPIAEAPGLGGPQAPPVLQEALSCLPQLPLGMVDLGQAIDEPGVDAGEAVDLLAAEALLEGEPEMEQPLRARPREELPDPVLRDLTGILLLAVGSPSGPADLQ